MKRTYLKDLFLKLYQEAMDEYIAEHGDISGAEDREEITLIAMEKLWEITN